MNDEYGTIRHEHRHDTTGDARVEQYGIVRTLRVVAVFDGRLFSLRSTQVIPDTGRQRGRCFLPAGLLLLPVLTFASGAGPIPSPERLATASTPGGGAPLKPPQIEFDERATPAVVPAEAGDEDDATTLRILGATVAPGTTQRLSWTGTELFAGVAVRAPVLVVNGAQAGITLCLTAAVHGDELNGIEIVRRVLHQLDADELTGTVIGVPIVNVQGFHRGSRYLPDRRDLNRHFPGNTNGSAADRIAYSFFHEVIAHCNALVDLHTGSFERANLPQLRADLRHPDIVTLTEGFGATVIIHSDAGEGTLRRAATDAGIPTVTLEAGGPLELELAEVQHGVKAIQTLLNTLGMVDRLRLWGDPEPVYYQSSWVRADHGGILFSDVRLGSTIHEGELLGTITDPITNSSSYMYSPYSGRVIGMSRNQVVMPGYATYHIGIATEQGAEELGSAPLAADAGEPIDTEEEGDSN